MLPFTLTSLLRRKARSASRRLPRAQEPADMGTAFGMEQWLDERDHAGKAAVLKAVTPSMPASRRWMPRWLQPSRSQRG